MVKKFFYLSAAALLFSTLSTAQQPAALPTPPKDDEGVVKISTDLIQIDVTVTDKNGKVVTGLGPANFRVLENGEEQKISNLTFVTKTVGGATVSGEQGGVISGQTPSTSSQPTVLSTRRTIAVVVDDLNLSFVSVHYMREALREFVEKQMEPGDLLAIIRTGVGIGALQQFTSDKRLLLSAIDRIRWNPMGSAGLDSLASVGQNAQDITERMNGESDYVAAKAGGDQSGRRSILVRESVADKKRTDYEITKHAGETEAAMYAAASLGSMKYIVSGMNELPGRKVMMLFSDGLTINPDATKTRSSAVYAMLRDLIDFANRSSVVVYTFDTKGMKSMSIQASDSTYEVIDGHRQQKERERLDSFRSSQEGLAMLAEQTGGKSLLNSNNLNYGIERALDEQSGYYLIGYDPDNETFDPAKRRFNKLEVKVDRPGTKVSYRSGFFNSADGPRSTEPSTQREINKALASPFSRSDIAVNVNALYADDPKDGPYIRSFLHIDANSLSFTEDAEGWKKATFDVAAVTFGDNGIALDNIESKYTIKAKGPTYETMLKKGFVYVLVMPLKTAGVLQFRVAVRDEGSGKIGSASQVIEVPDLKKQKLAIASLAVEDVSLETWDNITKGKVGSGPGQVKVPSTLPYDTVLKRFRSGTVLRYGFEVYNAKADGAAPRLETRTRILQHDRVVVDGAVKKVEPNPQGDPKHVQISGAVMLKDDLPAGDYVLQVLVTDLAAKKSAAQIFPFEIVK